MSRRRDRRRMGRAIALASGGQGRTGDNPSVGCVIADRDGHVVAEARTADSGRPHAEEIALEAAGEAARGGTAYVTLEPCRERTNGAPACSQRLVEAGIARVVIALMDQHPQGAGGRARLRSAGIQTMTGLKSDLAERLYHGFFERAKGADANANRS